MWTHNKPAHGDPGNERGIAAVLLLFALSAFSVLGVAGLTTALGAAPEGQTFNIFRSIPQDSLTRFAADLAVPNAWRTAGASGSFQFHLPVLVPEMAGEERGASAAYHAVNEVPGLSICCESQAGVCGQRNAGSGGPAIADWTPGTDDALWMSFELASRRDTSATDNGDTVTATVSQAAASQAPELLTGVGLAGTFAFVAACSGPSSSLNPTAPSATASAAAGASFNPNPTTTTTVSGRFTGGGFQIIQGDVDVKVTRGFTIHCDNRLTNNLEVNWGGGNNFHMDKNTVSAVCTRPVDPTPPASPVSRIVASATGQCNGLDADISFILEDRGEPGRNDQAQLIITSEVTGGCTLNLTLANLNGGNIQAHFDQPHK